MTRRNVTFTVGANVRNFEQGMKRVESRLRDVGRQTTWMGRDLQRGITMPFIAAGASVLALAHNTSQYADRISDLSDVTGINTDALQEWDFVANRVGVTTDVISSAFSSLGRRMSQFQRGSGPAVDAARQLGVEFRDTEGNIRSADDLLMDIIGSLSEMPADLDRAGIGTALFGRRWEMLAPIIGRGIDNISQMRQEAQDLGLVMSGESLEAANKYREEMVKFSAQMKAAGHNIALDFMPVILDFLPLATELAERAIRVAESFSKLDTETQKNRIEMAAYAAALGPLLIVLGSTTIAVEKLWKLMRLVVFNPKTAGIVGLIAYMAKLSIETGLAANQTNRLRSEMDKLTSSGAQASDLERLNELIVEQEKAIEQAENSFNRYGSSSRTAVQQQIAQIEEMKDRLAELIDQRDQAAALQMDNIIDEGNQAAIEQSTEQVENITRAVERLRIAAAKPINIVIDPTVDVQRRADEREFQEFEEALHNIFETDLPVDLEHRLFAPGSIGAANEALANLRNQYMAATDPERVREIAAEMSIYEEQIRSLTGETHDLNNAFHVWADLGVQVFDRMAFQGERLSSTLRSIKRQLATRGIMTLLTGGFGSSAGGFLGGLRNIFGINDAIISPRGDIITPHPDDYLIATKDPAGMAGNIRNAGSDFKGKLHLTGEFRVRGSDLVLAMSEAHHQLR